MMSFSPETYNHNTTPPNREEREKQRQMMLAQEKLAASQGMGMGLAAMEGKCLHRNTRIFLMSLGNYNFNSSGALSFKFLGDI